jgi:hypothetical protein
VAAAGEEIRAIHKVALVAAAALSLVAPAAAAAQGAARQTFAEDWTTKKPGKSFGRSFDADYFNPDAPGEKPVALRRIFVKLHRGAVIDTSAVPRCHASDEELMALGWSACPPESLVGTDVLLADTGFPGPARYVTSDSQIFNGVNELIFVARPRDTSTYLVVRGAVDKNTLDIPLPYIPGAPPDGTAFDLEHADFYARSAVDEDGVRHRFMTTPPRCPRSRQWKIRVTYTYADGVSQTARDTTPCRRKQTSRRST